MAREITSDQVVEAARELNQAEFTRSQVAEQLGVKTTDLKQAFKAAREANQLEKVRDDEEGKGQFRLAASS